jgi:hypothetical protein
MTKKIIICGFPHCGTTILKSIIGHSDDVEEICGETLTANPKADKNFVICKWPWTEKRFFGDQYKDYIKIFIMRNPLFVFSSLTRRFPGPIPKNHGMELYFETLKLYIGLQNNPRDDVFVLRYEDMFDDNFASLRNIFDKIGFEYTDRIFDNTKFDNFMHHTVGLVNFKPTDVDHANFRTWQINQPFVSNNVLSKIDLPEERAKKLMKNKYVLKVYPDIEKLYEESLKVKEDK